MSSFLRLHMSTIQAPDSQSLLNYTIYHKCNWEKHKLSVIHVRYHFVYFTSCLYQLSLFPSTHILLHISFNDFKKNFTGLSPSNLRDHPQHSFRRRFKINRCSNTANFLRSSDTTIKKSARPKCVHTPQLDSITDKSAFVNLFDEQRALEFTCSRQS